MDAAKQYLEVNPNATLAEFIEYSTQQEKDRLAKEHQRIRDCNKWYEDQVGKYFFIDFNGHSKGVFKLEKDNSNNFSANKFYSFYKDSERIKLEIEVRYINVRWLNNPYAKPSYGEDKFAKEITQEEYDYTVAKFEALNNIYNDMQNKF